MSFFLEHGVKHMRKLSINHSVWKMLSRIFTSVCKPKCSHHIILKRDKINSTPFSPFPPTRCGFYGNPIYLGYCSKCFKELVRDAPKDSAREGQTTDEQLYPGASGVCNHQLHQFLLSHTLPYFAQRSTVTFVTCYNHAEP